MAKIYNDKKKSDLRVNEEITYFEARVIYKEKNDETSENDFNKIMKVRDAKRVANSLGLDLIEINGSSSPPVLKIYDYKKYLYEQKQVEKKNKKHNVSVKEIQLSANISVHDLETKVKQGKKFIEKGERVKLVLTMRGRELSRREESSKSFYEFLDYMGDDISYEVTPRNDGNKVIAVIKKKK